MPLPSRDYDPSEAGISHALIRAAGHAVTFATPDGRPAQADPAMVSGAGFDAWGKIPVLRKLVLIGRFLRADRRGRAAHAAMQADPAFGRPLAYAQIDAARFDALLLPGGHAQGMREYLESAVLQRVVAAFFAAGKPVGAICHGVVLAARSRVADGSRSVLHGRKTTALTWAFERKAWMISRYAGRWWDRDYYRTYREAPGEPEGYRSVQAEVTRVLADPADFRDVDPAQADARLKSGGLARDTPEDARAAFVVVDGNYVSARWPGDAHTFARRFVELLA
ncbi:MAG TPA: type 1 glutamine amidotransferase domain-containing protein [Xanthomonadales bacterium]|nr:type 1 glutamine amidotransferase domain-containing protein [Xanthomonadales bacterium]